MSSPETLSKPKRMPPWMSMPGAPPRPDNFAFGSKLSQLIAEKRKYYDELNGLQKSMEESKMSSEDEEGKLLRQRLSVIDEELHTQNTLRVGKNTEISKLRQQARDANKQLRVLQAELGGLSNAKEIDLAIEQVMHKMETGGGGLQAEKRTLKRLQQLEEAKGVFFKVQTLTETIRDAEEREVLLQQEYREIHQRIGALSRELETSLHAQREKTKDSQATSDARSEIYKKCLETRARIKAINEQVSQLRAEHDKVTEVWNAWCTAARESYNAKLQAEFEERKRREQERIEAAKNRRKQALLKKLQHENQVEIGACDTLVQYLREKRRLMREEEVEEAKRNAAVNFDPAKATPKGFTLLNESKWAPQTSLNRADRKQQKRQQKARNSNTPAGEKSVHHPKEMVDLFHKIRLQPPLSLLAFDDSIAEINEKKKEYETRIVSESDVSSNDNEEKTDGAQQQEQQEECVEQVDQATGEEVHGETCDSSGQS